MARQFVTRVLRNGQKDDGAFDRAFWREQGIEKIFEAAFSMTNEVAAMRGEQGKENGDDQPRLQRSVVRVIRNKMPVGRE